METGSPSIAKVVTMALFALSCIGLMLFLWLSFGGTIPFNPQGYEFKIAFPNAGQLAQQADVRIAGVTVGKVLTKSLDPKGNRTIATIQMENKYAPVHQDARAILRMKTIIGETYVEMTPGSPSAPAVPDGGLLARGQVQNTVQLSDIFNALDPKTRQAFQIWQQELAKAIRGGNDQNLNNVLGNLPQFAADASDILRVLDVEHAATVRLIQNGGTVFAALSQDQGALRNLITSGETVFHTTAQNQADVSRIFEVFPTFLRETRLTMARLKSFALNTDPLIRQLVPVARDLGPTLHSVQVLSPYLRNFFYTLGERPASRGNNLIAVSRAGLPAVRDVLRGAKPLLGQIGPFLSQLNPIFNWLSLHQQLTSDFISNGATAVSGLTSSMSGVGLNNNASLRCHGVPCGHYLRQFGPTGPETFGLFANRDPNNRGNTYPPPLWLGMLATSHRGIPPAFDCKNTGAGGDGAVPADNSKTSPRPQCWVAPPLPNPGTAGTTRGHAPRYKIPRIRAEHYSSR